MKVFLAEDEFVVREGIKNNIDWTGHGYEFCGEAGDGEMAYSMIQKEQPDILIADIKMPFMDGLSLSRLIKAEYPAIEIILLTGYEEFAFAQEAIQIGVSRYLSKPISGDNLLKEINIVAEKIREREEERNLAKKYAEEMDEREQLEKQEFFRHLVTGEKELSEILEDSKKLGIEISGMQYSLLLLKIWSKRHDMGEYSGSVQLVEQKLEEMARLYDAILFDVHLEGKAILFKGESKEAVEQAQKDFVQNLKALFYPLPQIRYFGGISSVVGRITEIPKCYEEAGRAYAHLYLTDENGFIFGEEVAEAKGQEQEVEDIRVSETGAKQLDRRKLLEFLRRGEAAEVGFFLDEFFRTLGPKAMQSKMFRQYVAMDVYLAVMDFAEKELEVKDMGKEVEEPTFQVLADEKLAKSYLEKLLCKAIAMREDHAKSKYHDVVRTVVHYIEAHYGEEDLSLNQVAKTVNFSSNHLSAVFSQETGQPFIKYLTDYRMEKAKDLLRQTTKKTNEIGSLVGYKDSHYFSYLFKKTQGTTPTQYRGLKAGEEEA